MRLELTSCRRPEHETLYTDVLESMIRHDEPMGDGAFWLTVVSPERPDGPEILLRTGGAPCDRTVPGGADRRRHPPRSVGGG